MDLVKVESGIKKGVCVCFLIREIIVYLYFNSVYLVKREKLML